MPRAVQNIFETRKIQLCRLLDKTPSGKTTSKYSKRISHATHCIGNVQNRTTKFNNKSNPKKQAQKRSTCEGVMIWAVNRYVHRYRLTDRPLANTPLWATPWIRLRRASHYSIIKIISQLDNSKSIWLYLFYNHVVSTKFAIYIALLVSYYAISKPSCYRVYHGNGFYIKVLFLSISSYDVGAYYIYIEFVSWFSPIFLIWSFTIFYIWRFCTLASVTIIYLLPYDISNTVPVRILANHHFRSINFCMKYIHMVPIQYETLYYR